MVPTRATPQAVTPAAPIHPAALDDAMGLIGSRLQHDDSNIADRDRYLSLCAEVVSSAYRAG